jgi:hypothetical protein
MLYISPPAGKIGTQIVAHDGTVIAPDITGLYEISAYPYLLAQNWDFFRITPEGWQAPSAPISFSTSAMIPGLAANTWIASSAVLPPALTSGLVGAYRPNTPVMIAPNLTEVQVTFGGTFGGSEIVTLQLIPLYDPAGPSAQPIFITATATGVKSLTPAQLAALAQNKSSPLIAFSLQVKSSVSSSAVTAVATFLTK